MTETIIADPKKNEEISYKDVSIIISTHNRKEELFRTINNILKTTKGSYEIIVVSASSNDGTDEELPLRFPDARLILAPDVGWGEANNIGAKAAKGDYLFFSGPDMDFEDDWLSYLLEKAKKIQNLGSIGAVLFREYENKGIFITGGTNLSPGYVIHKGIDLSVEEYNTLRKSDKFIAVDSVHYPIIPRDIFFKVGGFDPYYFYTCDEIDIGIRIRRMGYKNIIFFGKYMKTSMTPSSEKTFYYWHRNWIRLIIKMNNLITIPIFIIYPSTKFMFELFYLTTKHDKKRRNLIIKSLHYTLNNFGSIKRSQNNRYVNENQ